MKTVFSNSQLSHVWAHRQQTEGRANSFYFYGDTIFSYGSHFPIAKHLPNGKVLFTMRNYSNTTAKHIALTRNAVSHKELVMCWNPNGMPDENFAQFERLIKLELPKLKAARKPEKYVREIMGLCHRAEAYADAMGVPCPDTFAAFQDFSLLTPKGADEMLQNIAILEREAELKKQKAEQKSHKENVKKWLKGETRYIYSRADKRDYLRLNGENVETSQGVTIPVPVAKRFYFAVKSGAVKVGANLAGYTVNEVTKSQIKIGCHTFPVNYLIKFGDKL
jgi:hypothetical protein